MPASKPFNQKVIDAFARASEIILGIRNVRKSKNIPNKEQVELKVKEGKTADCMLYPVVAKMGNLESIEKVNEQPSGATTFTVGSQEYYIPLAGTIDVEAELAKLEEELKYTKGFLISVSKKLSNERFVNNAPAAVVDKERQKQADAEARITVLENQIQNLNG
jgi:valyl-tRNA synthetase